MSQYYENRFSYKGYYFRDLSWKDQNTFLEHRVAYADINTESKKDILQIFLMVNQGGRQMDENHLAKIEEMYENTK